MNSRHAGTTIPIKSQQQGRQHFLISASLLTTRRSMLMLSGMVKMSLYPLLAATMANPMPVFPDVGSTKVVTPGAMSPRCSAMLIMLRAMRSLTELAGLLDSSLQTTSATHPSARRFNLTSGVLPMSSKMFSAMLALSEDVRGGTRAAGLPMKAEVTLLKQAVAVRQERRENFMTEDDDVYNMYFALLIGCARHVLTVWLCLWLASFAKIAILGDLAFA